MSYPIGRFDLKKAWLLRGNSKSVWKSTEIGLMRMIKKKARAGGKEAKPTRA